MGGIVWLRKVSLLRDLVDGCADVAKPCLSTACSTLSGLTKHLTSAASRCWGTGSLPLILGQISAGNILDRLLFGQGFTGR